MQNIRKKNQRDGKANKAPSGFVNRRHKPASKEALFRIMVILNISAWISLLTALVLFHYARPDFVSGVDKFWGVEGRAYWSQELIGELLTTLQVCLGLSLVSIILRARRSRRKADSFGINLLILVVISTIGLATIYTSLSG